MSTAIVIPAYNAAKFLSQTIESVLQQSVSDWTLTVVDDGSSDETSQIADRFATSDKRIRLLRQPNSGVASARNAGFANSDALADTLLLLDHDDMLQSDALSTLRHALDDCPACVGAHGMARKTDADGTVSESGNRAIQNYDRRKLVCGKTEIASRTEPTTPAMIVYDNLICTPGVCLLRRSALAQLTEGGKPLFDAAFQPLDDWDFWLRVTALGNLAFVDRVVLDWRRHDNAGSQNTSAMSDAELRIREHLVSADLPPELHEVALERYRKLTATRKRRAARDKFNAANVLFRKGKIGGGIASWGAGVAAYAQYLRSK